jgi:sugar-specific transcriptional regulator TrmB
MSIINNLLGAGLTQYEAKAYAALVELGESQTGKLSKKSGVPTSHLYPTLESLQEKGLVSYKLKNNVKVFQPGAPETLQQLYEQQQEALKQQQSHVTNAIANLKALPKNQESISNYQYFEGINGIKALFREINEQMKKNSKAVVLSANIETWKKLDAFLLEHHQVRVKKNVHERMILPKKGKAMAPSRKKIGKIDIRYLDHNNEAEYGVFGDLVAILYHGSKTPRGFLIKDPLFAQTFTNIFNLLWTQATP